MRRGTGKARARAKIPEVVASLPSDPSGAGGRTSQAGRTRDQLYEEAKSRGVKGRSKMTKDQLRPAVDAKKR